MRPAKHATKRPRAQTGALSIDRDTPGARAARVVHHRLIAARAARSSSMALRSLWLWFSIERTQYALLPSSSKLRAHAVSLTWLPNSDSRAMQIAVVKHAAVGAIRSAGSEINTAWACTNLGVSELGSAWRFVRIIVDVRTVCTEQKKAVARST